MIIENYAVYDQQEKVAEQVIKKEYRAPIPIGWRSIQLVSFKLNGQIYFFELTGDFGMNKSKLDNIEFSEKTLDECVNKFGLHRSNKIGSYVYLFSDLIPGICQNVIQISAGDLFSLIIFSYSNGEGRQPPSVYVHEIRLSETVLLRNIMVQKSFTSL